MNKLMTVIVLSVALIGANASFAATQNKDASASFDAAVKEYDFENNSYNISDEQLQNEVDTGNLIESDKKVSFWQKIVNSSHFSSKTATKTWIPLNKAE